MRLIAWLAVLALVASGMFCIAEERPLIAALLFAVALVILVIWRDLPAAPRKDPTDGHGW